jgi:para-aminobenzoate synthetase component 1
LPWPVWLDSGFPQSGAGRFDIIAADPYATLTAKGDVLYWSLAGQPPAELVGDALQQLRTALGQPEAPLADLPFSGGAIGFLGYDLARGLGDLAPRPGLDDWPSMAVGLYDWCLLIDHARQRSYFVAQGRDPRPHPGWQSALRRLLATPGNAKAPEAVHGILLEEGMARDDYAGRFDRIQRYIRDGDCYQVNLAQRLCAQSDDDPWAIYQRMRHENPSPYGAFLEYPFGRVLSSSPERFLSLKGRQAESRPIKGTRPRGETAAEDLALRAGLLRSGKDRAENVMIVDLLRNDLGRVCEPGSIEVPGLFQVESFATVHHLVSTVSGRLRDDCDAIDLLRACFPGGSITGAPKRRAMEIIDELEPVRREVYCGNVIRLGFDGNLDSSIAIRTALMKAGRLYYWAGGGIVADSDCDAEYQESLDKAAAFLRLLQLAPVGSD